MQEVFLLAMRALGSLKKEHSFGGWLCTIARNRGRDVLKSRRRIQALPEEIPHVQDREREEEAREIMAVIRGLPPTYAESLTLRLVEGLTGPEIAEKLGLTHGSVRVNLCRGMKLLRSALERREEPS